MTTEHFDVLIIGAGISGIGAAVHLKTECPGKSFAILEGRERRGGTWDLFRYPGIRSDSDMFTLGYAFKPWTAPKAIADAPSILAYLDETIKENGIARHIRYNNKVSAAAWDTDKACWTLTIDDGDEEPKPITCNFLMVCAGYYNYDAGYTPQFEGTENFKGQIIHPQHWPEDLETRGKNVVVIGSGATAVTIVPELAKDAHVTMLQRSPTYMVSRPSADAAADWLRAKLTPRLAYYLIRWRNILMGQFFFNLARKRPERVKARLIEELRSQLPEGFDIEKHFTPHYNPWDQRLCLVTDGDLFKSIREGHTDIVTDHIDRFTETGLKLKSGEELEADIIITATGLDLQWMGGIDYKVDGKTLTAADTMAYRGMMFSDLPNLASCFGYTNASWTLKVDLTCHYICRLLNYMDEKGYSTCTPRQTDPSLEEVPWLDFTSGYVVRSQDRFPRQGNKKPWMLHQNYLRDIITIGKARLDDGAMEFK